MLNLFWSRLGLWLSPKFVVNLKGDVGGFGLVGDDHVDLQSGSHALGHPGQ